ncbi:MAG: DUF5011 domain-containing protein [Clostridium sp.]|nr:DUF5011 domain-containing protein [Clostridium sp.]
MKGYKKIIALSIIATLVYSYFTGITVYSSDEITKQEFTNVSELQYEKKENNRWITGYSGNEEKLSLPEKIEDTEVTSIDVNAFKGSKIKEIKMPFIKDIGEGAFLDASTLEKIEVSNKVKINLDAFKGTNINTITIDYGEEDIADKTIVDWKDFVKKIDGINLENVTGKFIKNKDYTKNLDDTVGPVITLNGEAEINIEIGSQFVDLGATAYDEFEKVDTIVTSDSAVDTSKLGQYIITYKAIDSSRNITTAIRKVNVVDTVPPEIILNGDTEVVIEAGQKYEELGAIGIDKVDGNFKATVSGDVNTNVPGEYILTYTATDNSENSSTLTRKVKVIDTTAPEIILNGKSEITIEAGTKYEELGAIGKDIVDGELKATISGEVNTSKVGEYKLTYIVTDSSGNSATTMRKVNVKDTTAPEIILNGKNEITIEAGTQYVEPGARGKDGVDGTVEVKISGVIDSGKVGEYKINYTTSDKAGNKASAVRKIKVVDTVAPIITLNGDSILSLEVGNKYEELGAVAKDKVDGILPVTITGDLDVNKAGEYIITYKAVDSSKNESTTTRKVKVTEKIVEVENEETVKENNFNNKIIFIVIAGGIIILGGVLAGVMYYYRKRK